MKWRIAICCLAAITMTVACWSANAGWAGEQQLHVSGKRYFF